MIDFSETQSFKQQPWVVMALAAVLLWSWGLFIANVVLRAGGAVELAGVLSSLIPVVVGTALAAWFFLMRFDVTVSRAGITVDFKFVFFKRHISFGEIDSVFARQYNPLKDFGGWGVRYSKKNGTAVNVSGNEGVQLVFKDGKKLLLGSRRARELEKAIKDGMDGPAPSGETAAI